MTPEDIIRFWIDDTGPAGWYAGGETLDAAVRARFGEAWAQAEALTAPWLDRPEGSLAALILTDQFPRNMFRDDPRAFATDPLARRIADRAIAAGQDLAVQGDARQFFYMPFEHGEDAADQDRAVALFSARMPEAAESLRHARLHRDAIAAFGRFPWRNAALGRSSTPEEQAILDAGGYAALVTGRVVLPAAPEGARLAEGAARD